ncbi:hypothetical protein, partial [Vibrio parahaemolyticus]|uniref:hypothetical protein n=1 Tax=Vibrio parahaemolyticus TaxID=670 RepID=UPI00211505B0
EAPFKKWAIDFVKPFPIKVRRTQSRYVIIVTYYVMTWAEVSLVKDDITKITAKFLCKNIITQFGCLIQIMSDQGTNFL